MILTKWINRKEFCRVWIGQLKRFHEDVAGEVLTVGIGQMIALKKLIIPMNPLDDIEKRRILIVNRNIGDYPEGVQVAPLLSIS